MGKRRRRRGRSGPAARKPAGRRGRRRRRVRGGRARAVAPAGGRGGERTRPGAGSALTRLRAAPRTWPWPPHRLHRPATPATPQSARPSTPGAPRSPRGTMHGWSRRPLTRPPDRFPQVRRGCPLPRRRPVSRGRAAPARVVRAGWRSCSSLPWSSPRPSCSLRRCSRCAHADPAPQAPPVVVVPAPSPGDDGASSPAPSVAPSRAAEPAFRGGGERRRTDRAGPGAGRVDSGVRGDPAARGRGPASSSTSPTAPPGC